MTIQEEWEYIDSETQQARSVDILVGASVSSFTLQDLKPSQVPLFSYLNLVIECKQSDNPYIFFLRDSPPEDAPAFPEMLGPIKEKIEIFQRKENGEISEQATILGVRDVLGFYEFDYVLPALPYAVSLAKALRSKSKVEVTGEETYRALTYPLLKAVDHLKGTIESRTQTSWMERFVIAVAVVRAPMVGSTFSQSGEQRLISLPWVRVSRLEPTGNTINREGPTNSVRYYDVVHESYLDTYVDLLAEALNGIAKRVMKHSSELRSGAGSSASLVQSYRSLEELPEAFESSDKKMPTYMNSTYPGVDLENFLQCEVDSVNGAKFIDWAFPTLRSASPTFEHKDLKMEKP
ncbi:hypothetical protein [Streptomyces sp. AK02-04a]|uniref:hypothetical protein n=1 Tax=Streptomyces sp. AK02-04a TaxID=3028649 RepID=UPI0029A0F402|nr:hypothetical protein [Streptomyces sp. AK02-04a]MDX3756259.1 hypothetical protein [Streptomyces sp. AK02-04a]